MKKYFRLLFLVAAFISGCAFNNRAIRGGKIVDKYDIKECQLPIEEVYYNNLDGSPLYAWFIKKENYQQLPTIIYLHGSRGNIMDYLPLVKNLYNSVNANVFVCDFPGTGASKGKMSLKNTYQMTLASINYVKTIKEIRKDKIILYGVSMGATLAFYGAAKNENVFIIVESGVTSASDYMKKYFQFGLPAFIIELFGENFNNYQLVKNIKNPKLFIHGKKDKFIKFKYAQKLYNEASGPKDSLWLDGGHVLFGDKNNINELSQKIQSFIETYLPK